MNKPTKPPELERRFRNAYKIFRKRINNLANFNLLLTKHDADAMELSLDILLAARQRIDIERNDAIIRQSRTSPTHKPQGQR